VITEQRAQDICASVIRMAPRTHVEVLLQERTESLTRFAENRIHQNVSLTSPEVSVRVLLGKRVGRATTNRLDPEALARCLQSARSAAECQQQDPEILPLPGPQTYRKARSYVQRTAALSPEDRAAAIGQAVRRCKARRLRGAGKFEAASTLLAIANSKGLFASHRSTESTFDVTVMSDDSSGWAAATHKDVRRFDPVELAGRAVEKCLRSRAPVAFEPGACTVVLEPPAVTDFLLFLAIFGFGGLACLEGRSFASGNLGRKILGGNVTITDDAYAADATGLPFDFEGMPRQAVTLVDKGILTAVVHDRQTAAKAGTRTTGHALPQPNNYGPIPLNPCFGPGQSSLEQMIADTERGLLVTHFHYTNIIDPMRMILTGMTRDGTFLIEKGRVTRGVRNLRFTESLIEALNRVRAVSRERISAPAFWGSTMLVPAMQIDDFHFTSATAF